MTTPEVNAAQMKALEDLSHQGGDDAFFFIVPEELKDGTALYLAKMDELRDINQLVILGLLEDISEQGTQKVAEFFVKTGRAMRFYKITAMGKAMFSDHGKRRVQ